ncbi:hypothetical protein Rhe02_79890 [Rhizocola hellebori]|uniref:Uncharacterized protein n=1 Tax=Rhizocola hellebori TaxID=1392758 RepID=A0A8J3QHV3_9ACTN|nr:hypothetical protein [Rhizocola hellebori]GIH09922.1 hypothetical protein Rhe02_79890 [Rhizocola hellebori]
MPLAQTEAVEAASDIDAGPSGVEPGEQEQERSPISERITRYGAYDRLEG